MRRVAAVVVPLLVAVLVPTAALPSAGAQPAAAPPPCEAGAVPAETFLDVVEVDVHREAIGCAVWWELARGTGPGRFAPTAALTRGQAATLIARLLGRAGVTLAPSPADAFTDDPGSVHAYATNRLAAAGVVNGRSAGRFVPLAPVTRGELVTMLVRALERVLGPLPAGADAFGDDEGSVHEPGIDTAAALGIVRGTGDGRFAPSAALTRAQAASLVTRALDPLAAAGELGQRPDVLRAASGLRSFDDCDALLGHIKERALELVGPAGLGGAGGFGMPVPGDEESGGGEGGDGDRIAPSTPTTATGSSGTNVQEAGVDEADIVKTDGRRLLTVVDDRLRVVDVTDPAAPRLAGTLDLDPDGYSELLLSGDRALVLTTSFGFVTFQEGDRAIGIPEEPRSTLTLVDLGAGPDPRVVETMTVDGTIAASRMIDGVARIVLSSNGGDLPFVFPSDERTESLEAAERQNRELVMQSTLADWLPRYSTSGGGSGPLLGCGQVRVPPEYSGLGTLSVLTADLSGALGPDGSVGVLAGGETVYASARSLYVATSRWGPWRPTELEVSGQTTEIHGFDITSPSGAAYVGSGEVAGFVLNQFSMSEHEGVLRVATTTEPGWLAPGPGASSESRVVTLRPEGGRLVELGSVAGLGRGERIFAVRFIGDVGYVVTFRRIDPLYTLDLSDPAAPRVVGELKINGYSAYLHPISDTLLLGVGQDADDDGRALGTQVSLFDVSDPAAPQRVSQAVLEGSFSEVEFDHRAFLWWGPASRAVIPVSRWTFAEDGSETSRFVGAVGFAVDRSGGVREVGRLTHEDDVPDPGDPERPRDSAVRRSVAVGETLLTVSQSGVESSTLSTLAHLGWLGF